MPCLGRAHHSPSPGEATARPRRRICSPGRHRPQRRPHRLARLLAPPSFARRAGKGFTGSSPDRRAAAKFARRSGGLLVLLLCSPVALRLAEMATMFNALNRFMLRLDGSESQKREQEKGAFGFQVLRNTSLELAIEPWFDYLVGINGRPIVRRSPMPVSGPQRRQRLLPIPDLLTGKSRPQSLRAGDP